MKIKMMSLLAVMLFMGSSVKVNANSGSSDVDVYSYACWGVADATVAAFQTANLLVRKISTYEQEFNVWAAAYDACNGS